ncbi:MAG: fatty acid cis/trans isomerase, partial [Deltaproteobacteria bacterium]|nr:fatty acid cis/trans isomerase [Deltaproteobacteria bacterium]
MTTARLAAITLGFCLLALLGYACAHAPFPELPALPEASPAEALSYREDVGPVFERRCVACHSCYDAPCQLLASSYEGIERGATQQAVYDSARLRQADPTRLGLDAQSVEEWRELDFVSVLEGRDGAGIQSLLLSMLALGRAHSFTAEQKLSEKLPLDIGRSLSCPTLQTLGDYVGEFPMGGMPYGTAPLSDDEVGLLATWVKQGAPGPGPAPPLPARSLEQVQRWEAFLNGESLKERITARYLYEHWVFAHLYFEAQPNGPFFRIYRSTTP